MKRFQIVAVLLLLWNLAGIAAFVTQFDADPVTITDPITARAFTSMPGWVWVAYGVAVLTGTAGAIALLLRRKVAATLFAVSVVAMVLQFGWTFLIFRLLDYKGATAAVFPAILIAVGVFAAAYAYGKQRDGTLR